MRKLTIQDISIVSGGSDCLYHNPMIYNYAGYALLYGSYIAETVFGGYCGYYMANLMSLNGYLGIIVGAAAGFTFIYSTAGQYENSYIK